MLYPVKKQGAFCEYHAFCLWVILCFYGFLKKSSVENMFLDYYEWQTLKGPITVEKNHQSGFWDLCLNGIVLQQGYTDPDQAAYEASKSEFGKGAENSILKGIYVPSELKQWSNSRQRRPQKDNQNN